MKTIRKYYILIIVFLISFGVFAILGLVTNSSPIQMYSKITLFEKAISTDTENASLYLFHSRAQYDKNYFTLTDLDFSLAPDIPCPGLVAIDGEGNYYISNANENLKVFDQKGNFMYKFDYPDRYYGTFSTFDADDNIYMFLKKEDNNSIDTLVYKINAINKVSVSLDKNQISELDRTLIPPQNHEEQIAKKKREHGEGGIYYEVQPSAAKVKTIFKYGNGRFVSPELILIYRLDQSFDFKSNIPGDEYIYDKLDVSNISSDKIIYINTYWSDKHGNIFVSGVKSNEIERTKVKIDNEEKDAVKIYNLKFFIWEFERKQ